MFLKEFKALIENTETKEEIFSAFVNSNDHFETARLIHEFTKKEKIRIFHVLKDRKRQQDLLNETDQDSRVEILDFLKNDFIADFLKEMPEDDATDIIKDLSEERQNIILSLMAPKVARNIKNLIRHGEETVGSLMTLSFNKVSPLETAAKVLIQFKNTNQSDIFPYFYVTNERNELLGFFKLRDLLNVPSNFQVGQLMRKNNTKVFLEDGCEKVANLMDHEKISAVPVVNENNIIQGIITFDDVIHSIQEIADENIFTMVGTSKVDPFAKKTMSKFFARAPWLLTTFIGGIMSAFILRHYADILQDFTTVIYFVPFVIGLAGNVGIQGATVIVRGTATGDIQSDNLKTVVISEIRVGILNGVIFGSLFGVVIAIISKPILYSSPLLGLTVGTGIVLAVSVAAFIGSLAPIVLMRLDMDPAISAGPFITVANDIIGLLIYLSATGIIYSFL
jgi:magnesium transporter